MVVVFANNLTLVAIHGTATTVTTDPVPLNGMDRASCAANVHSLITQGGTATLSYQAEVSLDGGQTWFDATGVSDSFSAAGSDKVSGQVLGALLRFEYTFSINVGGAAGDIAACCFDLHVNLDHS